MVWVAEPTQCIEFLMLSSFSLQLEKLKTIFEKLKLGFMGSFSNPTAENVKKKKRGMSQELW